MDSEFEKIFIKNFFDKRCSNRLQHELSSPAKREKFFARMAHTAEDYIKKM